MKESWENCRRILCVRLDNMGDLMMSTPAIRALKQSFACEITMLTSSAGAELTPLIPEITHTLIYNAAWVKSDKQDDALEYLKLVEHLKEKQYDACVIFTVYSQNPMPAILLAFLAEIPLRLAYCRENPYHLLSDWIPDEEPYRLIKHQVKRDLDLVAHVGAFTDSSKFKIDLQEEAYLSAEKALEKEDIDIHAPYFIFHCGVSEEKRKFPEEIWIKTAQLARSEFEVPILLSGSEEEKEYITTIQKQIGCGSYSIAGLVNLEEFIWTIKNAVVVVSVNTGTIHLAAAVNCPTVVLYAQSNPQHTPWQSQYRSLEYSIPRDLKSKNEVINYVDRLIYSQELPYPSPENIIQAIREITSTSLRTRK